MTNPHERNARITDELNRITLARFGWLERAGSIARKLNEESRRDPLPQGEGA